MMPDWLRRILSVLRPAIPADFVGTIEINVFKGGIANVNVRQSFAASGEDPNRAGRRPS